MTIYKIHDLWTDESILVNKRPDERTLIELIYSKWRKTYPQKSKKAAVKSIKANLGCYLVFPVEVIKI